MENDGKSYAMIDPTEPIELPDGTIIQGRLEKFLYALCCLDYQNLPTPLSRIEVWANAMITGELPDIVVLSRAEEFFKAVFTGETDNLPIPQSRAEVLLDKLARNNDDLTDVEPIQSRYELLLAYLIKNGGLGNIDYVLYEFQQNATLFNTVEKPFKEAVMYGETLVNILPTEQTLRNKAEHTQSQKFNENYPEINVVDGISKKAILEGQTLVNLIKKSDKVTLTSYKEFQFIQKPIPNTKYLIMAKFSNNTSTNSALDKAIFLAQNILASNNWILKAPNSINGIEKLVVTTVGADVIDTANLKIGVGGTFGGTIDVEDVMMIPYQEGMETWDIPYFEGMKNVTYGKRLENLLPLVDTISITKNEHSGIKEFTHPIELNKKYILRFKVSNLNLDGGDNIKLSYRGYLVDGTYKATAIENNKLYIDKNGYFTFLWEETTQQFKNILIGISGSTTSENPSFDISEFMVVDYYDNIENKDIPYFEGTTVIDKDIVTSVGKNLCDNSKNKMIEIDSSTGNEYTSSYHIVSDYIRVKNNNVYSSVFNAPSNLSISYRVYDNDKKYLGYELSLLDGKSGYVRLRCFNDQSFSNINDISFMMSYSAIPTTYEPYKENTLQIKRGTNLFDGIFEYGTYNDTDGSKDDTAEADHIRNVNKIKTIPNSDIVFGNNGHLRNTNVYEYDIDNNFIKYTVAVAKIKLSNTTEYICISGGASDRDKFTVEQGSTPTLYEPYGTLNLRGIGDVKDTLDINKGIVTRRIGEIIINGGLSGVSTSNGITKGFVRGNPIEKNKGAIISNNLPTVKYNSGELGIRISDSGGIYVQIPESYGDINIWLSENPITVQYELATPIVQDVELSSHGNWNKIVLDGSEDWKIEQTSNYWCKLKTPNDVSPYNLLPILDNIIFKPSLNSNVEFNTVWYGGGVDNRNGNIIFNIADKTIDEWKQWLSENPITLWYLSYNNGETEISEFMSFNDGHMQFAEHTLIPNVEYEVSTNNSWHIDMMKANTDYTYFRTGGTASRFMAYGIDGFYWQGNKNKFNSGIMATNEPWYVNGTVNDFMLIEGDHTQKEIPYFTGMQNVQYQNKEIDGEYIKMPILSSIGKNLWNGKFVRAYPNEGELIPNIDNACTELIPVKPNTHYTAMPYGYISSDPRAYVTYTWYDNDMFISRVASTTFAQLSPKNATHLRVHRNTYTISEDSDIRFMIIEGKVSQDSLVYEPYKSNILSLEKGINLFDGELEYGTYDWNGNRVDNDNVIRNINPIEVSGNISFKSTHNNIDDIQYIFQYDKNMNFIEYTTNYSNSLTLNVETKYINFRTQTNGVNNYVLRKLNSYKIQIEQGSTPTTYSPYGTIQLNGIGEVHDELDLNSGTLTQRTRLLTTYNYDFTISLVDSTTKNTFKLELSNPNIINAINQFDENNGICNKLPYKMMWTDDVEGWYLSSNGNKIIVRLNRTRFSSINEDSINEYLLENPLMFVLKKQDTTKIDLQVIDEQGNEIPKVKSFDGVTYVTVHEQENSLLPIVSLDVATSNEEDLATIASLQNDVLTKSKALNTQAQQQSEEISTAMLGLVEVYEDVLD